MSETTANPANSIAADATEMEATIAKDAKTAEQDTAKGASKLEAFADDAKEVAGNIFSKVRDFGENVAGATRDMVNGAKLNNEKAQKKAQLDSAFQKLGEMAYRQGGLTGEMAQISDQIHELYQQLQNIEIRRNAADQR